MTAGVNDGVTGVNGLMLMISLVIENFKQSLAQEFISILKDKYK